MIKELSIDLETYSDVDISKCGAYKYAESDNFEILLFGVSVDNGSVVVYDLTAGDEIPTEILKALSDKNITKCSRSSVLINSCAKVRALFKFFQHLFYICIFQATLVP